MKSHFHEIFFRNFFKIFTAIILVAGFLYILSPFIIPFVFGVMLAMALSPFLAHFMIKYKWSRQKALLVLTLIMFFTGAVPLGLFCYRGARIISQFFSKQSVAVLTQNMQDRVYATLDNMSEFNKLDSVMVREKFDNFITQAASWTLKTMSDLVTQIPDYVLAAIVIILSFYFFFRSAFGSPFLNAIQRGNGKN